MAVLASACPAGTSVHQFIHYFQSIKNGDFRFFDYHDKTKNLEKYGSEIPPRYNLSAITCKSILYYSKDDFFIQEKVSYYILFVLPD